jgi:hypothetical protein
VFIYRKSYQLSSKETQKLFYHFSFLSVHLASISQEGEGPSKKAKKCFIRIKKKKVKKLKNALYVNAFRKYVFWGEKGKFKRKERCAA